MVNRDNRGRVVPGTVLNPVGRPKGPSVPSEAKKIRDLIAPEREALIANLIKIAKGDGQNACKASDILLSYVSAKARPVGELVWVPGIAEAADLEGKCAAVLAAVASGQITSTAAKELLDVIAQLAKIVEVSNLQEQIRELQERVGLREVTSGSPPAEQEQAAAAAEDLV